MASIFEQLRPVSESKGAETQDREMVFDGGAYRDLAITVLLLRSAAPADTLILKIQHAPVNEESWYVTMKDANGNDIELDLNDATGPRFYYVNRYSRFVRYIIESAGTATTLPILGINLVAKE